MNLIKRFANFAGKYFLPALGIFTLSLLVCITYIIVKTISKPVVIEKKKAEEPSTGPLFKINPDMVSAKIGESFNINLIIDTKSLSVSAVDLTVTYDPTVLRVNYVNQTTFLPVVLRAPTINEGTISMALGSDPTAPKTGVDSLALINFTVIYYGNITINYNNTSQAAAIGQSGNIITSLTGVNVLVPTPTLLPASGSTVTIYAAGTFAKKYPSMDLLVDNKVVLSAFEVSGDPTKREFKIYTYNSPVKLIHSQIKVRFTNDFIDLKNNIDRNLDIDKINIDGVDYQTEDQSIYTLYDKKGNCQSGYRQSEWLNCNGYFRY